MQHEQHDGTHVHDDVAVEELLLDLLDEHAQRDEPDLHATTFEEAGVMTTNRGLRVTMPDGGVFDVTVAPSR